MHSPKILFVIGSLGVGGAELQLLALIMTLVQRGFHCELFVLDATGALRERLESESVRIHDGAYNSSAARWKRLLLLGRALCKLILVSLRTRPDVLHAYLPLTNFMGALAGRLASVRLVITSKRALGTHQDRHRFWKVFDRTANLLSHCIIGNSQAVLDDTVTRDGVNHEKLRLIYNGIDVERFERARHSRDLTRSSLKIDRESAAIVAVGNLIPYKGHADLLRAVRRVVDEEFSARFFFVGEDRGIERELRRLAEELGVSDQVVFLGRREDVAEILAAMDIFVMPSHEEGFSNALLEAMASGLAVVATDVGGNSEALENGGLGILVPPHDPDALAMGMMHFLADGAARSKAGEHARQALRRRYSITAMVDAHVSLYLSGLK